MSAVTMAAECVVLVNAETHTSGMIANAHLGIRKVMNFVNLTLIQIW